MPGYVMILLFTVLVILLNLIVLQFRKKLPAVIKVISVLFLCFWIATILIPSLLFLIPPYTPTIKGRVIDAETGKPLANINIKAGWRSATAEPVSRYKSYSTATNETGAFYLPLALKVPSFFAPPFIYWYDGIDILAYSHDYKFSWKRIDRNKEFKPVELAMEPSVNDEDYFENVRELSRHISYLTTVELFEKKDDLTSDERNFIIEARRLFEKKFPESNLAEDNLLELSGLYGRAGDHIQEIGVLQEIIERFPSSKTAEFAEYEINRLVKDYNLKIRNYKKRGR